MAAKHLEPTPQPSGAAKTTPAVKQPIPKLRLAVFATLAIVAGGALLTAWWPGNSDHVSQATQAELLTSFATMAPLKLERVAPQDVEQALDSMHLDAPQRAQLRAAITPAAQGNGADQTGLAWIEVWDFAQEDGDIVHLSSAGFNIDCNLLHAHQRIAIPVDASKRVAITGKLDGGGGITLGVQAAGGPVMLPVLAPGQTLQLPIGI